MTASTETPQAYLTRLPPARRAVMQVLHDAIRATVPELTPFMMSGIIGYGRFRYRYASGREGEWFLVGLCARKAHYSAYLCATDDHGYLAEQHAASLGNVKVGRSCITFRRLEDLNLPAFLALVRQAETLGGAGAVP